MSRESSGLCRARPSTAAEVRPGIERRWRQSVGDLARLQSILETALDAVVVMDAQGAVADWSPTAETLFGWRREEVLGLSLGALIVPPRSRDAHQAGMRRFLATGEPHVLGRFLEMSALRRGGEEFPVELSITTWPTSEDGPYFLGFVRDISERRRTMERLGASESLFRSLADAAPAPVWLTGPDGNMEFVNAAFAEVANLERDELTGEAWLHLLHPDDIDGFLARRASARERYEAYSYEARFWRRREGWRWMLVNAKPRVDVDGAFLGYVGMAVDLSDIKAAQAHQQLLINELNHRVKNTLASIQSIARQTLGAGALGPQAREQFIDRLMAMSAAHDVLTSENWAGAVVDDILREALRPFADDQDQQRISPQGPPLRVGPGAALALALAAHELGTNAVKHGALSSPMGQVRIDWWVQGDKHAVLRWRESGGPPVQPPGRRGFGRKLLERGLAGDLGGKPELLFHPEGVEATLRFLAAS